MTLPNHQDPVTTPHSHWEIPLVGGWWWGVVRRESISRLAGSPVYRIPVETGREGERTGTGCFPSIGAKLSLSVEEARF